MFKSIKSFLKFFSNKTDETKLVPIMSKEFRELMQKRLVAEGKGYMTNTAPEMVDDKDAFSKMLRNGKIRASHELRVDKTLTNQITCENNPEIHNYLTSFSNFRTMLRWLTGEGFGKGIALIRPDFEQRHFEQVDFQAIVRIKEDGEFYWARRGQYGKATKISQQEYLLFVYNELEHTLGFGEGYLHWAFYTWKAVNILLKKAFDNLDGIGGAGSFLAEGIDIGRLATLTRDEIQAYLLAEANRLIEMKSAGVLVYDQSNSLDMLDPKPFPKELWAMIKDLSVDIIKIIQGATLNSGGEDTAGGNRAMGDIAEIQSEDKAAIGRMALVEPITRLYVMAWEYLGCPGERPEPVWGALTERLQVDEKRLNLDIIKFFGVDLGYTLSREQISEKLGGWDFGPDVNPKDAINLLERQKMLQELLADRSVGEDEKEIDSAL